MWRGTMYQGKMSEDREVELKAHLQRKSTVIKLSPESIQKIIDIVNKILTSEIKLTDWMPGLENIVRYQDMLVDFMIEEFLTDEFLPSKGR